jgi:hypothetical protein
MILATNTRPEISIKERVATKQQMKQFVKGELFSSPKSLPIAHV